MRGNEGPRPVHPILFAAFPILLFTAHNRDVASPRAAAVPLAASVALAGALQLAGGRLLGSRLKVAIVVSTAAALFFTYGHVWNVLEGRKIAGVIVGRDLVLLPLFALVGALVFVLTVRTKRPLARVTSILNTVGTVLVITGLATIGIDVVRSPGEVAVSARPLALEGSAPKPAPDIYYLIFDRYPDAETLERHFGFDNEPFLRFLKRRGFVIASGARANYQNTHLSLASSLNVSYLDGIRRQVGGPSRDLSPAFRALSRSAVARFLRTAGYRYVHVGSWWSPTAESPIADVNLRSAPLSEYARTLYASTALQPLLRRGWIAEADRDAVQRSTTRRELAALERAIELDGPTFVFAHFLIPHPPYVFDRRGGRLPPQGRAGNVDGFLEQLRYTNTRIKQIVDRILARTGEEIVIIQADEGPYPRLETKIPGSWTTRPDGELRVKYGILSAFHLPGAEDALYTTISPVNAFRVVLNRYFGADLPLLPDESYASRSSADVYDFVPLGDRVRGTPASFGHHG